MSDMFEWDKTDPNNWVIKAKRDLYGVGEISAYGYRTGENPNGTSYLHELKDVIITNPTNKQVLTYNVALSKWVNGTVNYSDISGTPPATDLSGLVKKIGDTMTGSLTSPMFIKVGGTANQFLKADGSVDSTGYLSPSNWQSIVDGRYLLLTGGNLSGALTVTTTITASDKIKSDSGRLDLDMATLRYDSVNKAIYAIMADGTPCSIYATGDVSAYAVSGTGILNKSYTFGNKLFVDSLKTVAIDTAPTISLAIGDIDTGFNWISTGKINIMANNIAVAYWNSTEFYVNKNLYITQNLFTTGVSYLTGNVSVGTTNTP